MELYQKVFGRYLDGAVKQGNNLVIKCLWHNDKNPSLSISTDPNKKVYKCWACGKSGSLIGAYMELNKVDYKTALKELGEFDDNYIPAPSYVSKTVSKQPKIKQKNEATPKEIEDFEKYITITFDNTIKFWDFFYKKLYELRGITLDTATCCMIGYDKNKGWIFPIIRYPDMKFVGYEIREKNFGIFDFNKTKCYKAPNSHSCLSVTYLGDCKKAIICEGFVDSYKMYQYLHEKAQMEQKSELAQVSETILTPSMGVKTVPELVQELKLWNDFDEIVFCLDNDNAGNTTADMLRVMRDNSKENLNFTFFGGLEQGEDFENWYDKKVNKGY